MAGKHIDLTAADGHKFQAYKAVPTGQARGSVVVVQEIFGVNRHIRSVVESYAAEGYVAVAPALFDRKERGVELTYTAEDVPHGREIAYSMGWDEPLLDIQATMAAAAEVAGTGKAAAVVGYCWGGSLAWLSATRLKPSAAVGYYGGQIHAYREERPGCPTILHFGRTDDHIPMEHVEEIDRRNTDVPVYVYDAGHGFNCNDRGSYHQPSAELALERTLQHLARTIG